MSMVTIQNQRDRQKRNEDGYMGTSETKQDQKRKPQQSKPRQRASWTSSISVLMVSNDNTGDGEALRQAVLTAGTP